MFCGFRNSFVYSFLTAAMGLAAAAGSIVLSATLARTGSFDAFLVISAIVTVFGAAAFYFTGRIPARDETTPNMNTGAGDAS